VATRSIFCGEMQQFHAAILKQIGLVLAVYLIQYNQNKYQRNPTAIELSLLVDVSSPQAYRPRGRRITYTRTVTMPKVYIVKSTIYLSQHNAMTKSTLGSEGMVSELAWWGSVSYFK